MAKSNLHQLSERGQSASGSTTSRAICSQSGELERMMREDAVVGVTSNPTIFQKAISAGDAYDEQLREVLEEERRPEGDLHPRSPSKDVGDACDLLRQGLGRGRRAGRLRLDRGRSDARLRHRGDGRPGDRASTS